MNSDFMEVDDQNQSGEGIEIKTVNYNWQQFLHQVDHGHDEIIHYF